MAGDRDEGEGRIRSEGSRGARASSDTSLYGTGACTRPGERERERERERKRGRERRERRGPGGGEGTFLFPGDIYLGARGRRGPRFA